MASRFVLFWLAWAAPWAHAAWGEEGGDVLTAQRQRLETMGADQKDELRRNKGRFDRLTLDEQQRLRQLHEQICRDPQAQRLEQVMVRYNEWLRSLPSGPRTDLLRMKPDERIVEIKKHLEHQEKQRFHELVLKTLQPEDYGVLLNWQEAKLLAALTPQQREQLSHVADPRRRRMEVGRLFRQVAGDQGPRSLRELPVSAEDVQELASKLSPEARAVLEKERDLEAQRGIVRNWLGAAMFSRLTPRVTREELQRFLEQHVDPQRREYIENLPRDRLIGELQRMYYLDRFRGGQGEPPRGPYRKRPPGEMFPGGSPPPDRGLSEPTRGSSAAGATSKDTKRGASRAPTTK